MAAPTGNQFWKMRSSHGRKPLFLNPEDLWAAACEYFEWVDSHPLEAAELVKFQGRAKVKYVPKMRVMTILGLCIFLDISTTSFNDYSNADGFSEVCTRIKDVITTQKFSGAAADLLNPSIIARDLGLVDKVSTTIQEAPKIDKIIDGMSEQEMMELYRDIMG